MTPGHAACLAIAVPPASAISSAALLKPVSPVAASPAYTGSGIGGGFTPADLHSAYNLPSGSAGTGQTVGIVDATTTRMRNLIWQRIARSTGSPRARPQTAASGRSTRPAAPPTRRRTPYGPLRSPSTWTWSPRPARTATFCWSRPPRARSANLYASEDEAVALGATEVSNSWGGRGIRPDIDRQHIFRSPRRADHGWIRRLRLPGQLSGVLTVCDRRRRHKADASIELAGMD